MAFNDKTFLYIIKDKNPTNQIILSKAEALSNIIYGEHIQKFKTEYFFKDYKLIKVRQTINKNCIYEYLF